MNSYWRSNRKSGGHPTGYLQSGEPDLREASLLRLATTFEQLNKQAQAIASRLSAIMDQHGPVWLDYITTRSRQVLTILRCIYDDHHAMTRYVAHLVVLVMVLASLPISQIKLSGAIESAPPQARDVLEKGGRFLLAWTEPSQVDAGYVQYAAVPHTTLAEPDIPGLDGEIIDPSLELPLREPEVPRSDAVRPRESVITYIVQPGDSPWEIADRFNISWKTVMWANPALEERPDRLAIGQELLILPVSGVYHTVARGDTLASIAKQYNVDPAAITALTLNNLSNPPSLQVGQKIIVPDGQKLAPPKVAVAKAVPPKTKTTTTSAARTTASTKQSSARVSSSYSAPVPATAAKGAGSFAWPVGGSISQRYSRGHPGLDVATRAGTPIVAADAGYVVYAGWSSVGYGNMVLIDHGNGSRTLYAHMSQIIARAGQSVTRGTLIGKVGCTGRCTGPHLHLEIIQNGVKRNPLQVLGR